MKYSGIMKERRRERKDKSNEGERVRERKDKSNEGEKQQEERKRGEVGEVYFRTQGTSHGI